jgi:CMP-2-keto-3-deoxyoctulosonic acid synthetase
MVNTGLFHEVIVATDSDIIYNEWLNGGRAVIAREHESGSDRIAETVEGIDVVSMYRATNHLCKKSVGKTHRGFSDEKVQVASQYKIEDDNSFRIRML